MLFIGSNKQQSNFGIKQNLSQFLLLLLQVFLLGLLVGMTRIVIPAMAKSEFGLEKQQFFILGTFVVVFGIMKSVSNLFAGKLSDNYGRTTGTKTSSFYL